MAAPTHLLPRAVISWVPGLDRPLLADGRDEAANGVPLPVGDCNRAGFGIACEVDERFAPIFLLVAR